MRHPFLSSVAFFLALLIMAPSLTDPPVDKGSFVVAAPAVRISQVYGAGGNQGALWQADFVELFNAGDVPVPLAGWAVEYAAADGANWRRTPLDSLTIAPAGYLLVAQAAGNSGAGAPLPPADAGGTINLNASSGKVRLVDSAGAIVDRVGYGGATAYEGAGPAPPPSAGQAVLRKEGGCVDTDQNQEDFLLDVPDPRNSGSPGRPCAAASPPPPAETPTATVVTEPAPTETPPAPDPPTSTAPPPAETPVPATPTPIPGGIFISEFLADPAAVDDALGEWLELHNVGPEPVNLRHWILADLDQDRHTIASDLWVEAGAYVVLARNGDATQNGGVAASYVYSGLSLANGEDELLLLAPDGVTVDQVSWGNGTRPSVTSGASLYRSHFGPDAVWLTAGAAWPGSAGDLGHPGGAPPPPSATPTPTPTAAVPPTPAAVNAALFISEWLADPKAVADSSGEWLEIFNAGPDAVNLQGWMLADTGRDRHTIDGDLWLEAGSYAVLARNGDAAQNGGVNAHYVYGGLSLANGEDSLLLFNPGGQEMDRVSWGGASALFISPGASLERTSFDGVAQWQTAAAPWPGSAGDWGSPGAPFVLAPTPTPLPSPTGTPSPATVTPTAVDSPTATPAPIPTRPYLIWPAAATPALLQIEEVYFRGSGSEYVSLVNVGTSPLDLSGWRVGDAHLPGAGEGIYALPDGHLLASGEPFVIARNGTDFQARWGIAPHAQFEDGAAGVPVLIRQRDLASGTFALNDNGDEVVLLDPQGRLADAVAYGSGDGAALGLVGVPQSQGDYSLHRAPDVFSATTTDLRHRFLWAPAAPSTLQTRPVPHPVPQAALPDSAIGLWGSLGASSTFSPGGIAPPEFVAWAAAANGLHFIAIADPVDPALRAPTAAPVLSLPAWRWLRGETARAIVYGPFFAPGPDPLSLMDGLAANGALAQWIGDDPPAHPAIVAISADGVRGPGDLYAHWRKQTGTAPLLAGNTLPALPGYLEPAPRYTGLAVRSADAGGIGEALRAGRGWLTTRPGLALTLRSAGGAWMGEAIPAAGEVTLVVDYQDHQGEVAGLALWQDDRPIRQLDLPPVDGPWSVRVPALPGALLYAVATQADGDFAATAPLRVLQNGTARVWINEILPVPISDFNGDGLADSSDEYIELYNAGPDPISLAGWHLEDRPVDNPATRRRFTLGPEHFLAAGERLLLWGGQTYIGLNNRNERLDLLDAAGNLVDSMEWTDSPGADRSFSRVPDGGGWQIWSPTPGQSNGRFPTAADLPTPTPPAWVAAGSAAPGTPGGEATGPFGSVTQAKLAGLEEGVRFVGVVTVPPGLFNSAIYVADPAPAPNAGTSWLGIRVYLQRGAFPPLAEGDQVDVQGIMHSFRGEREVLVARPEDLWRVEAGEPLAPLPVTVAEIGEALEGRLVTFEGMVTGYRGSSFFLADPETASAEPVEVHVRSSLAWRRPYVNEGERWRVVGIVNQFAQRAPWNGGYRVLVRFERDLSKVAS